MLCLTGIRGAVGRHCVARLPRRINGDALVKPACLPLIQQRTASGKREQYAPDPRRHSFAERGYIARDAPRPQRYWPPVEEEEEAAIELPGGRKAVSVRAMKRDVDGAFEAQVVFTTRGGNRLFWLNEEELDELEKLAPRISEYMELWQEKAALEAEEQANARSAPELEQSVRRQFVE